jgi:phosphoribosylanthranilate isomerase
MIVQIYEIQTPSEAEQIAALGVDHIGSVLLSTDPLHRPEIKATVDLVRSLGRKSSMIPLFADIDPIVEMIDYYRPDIVHFCDTLPSPETDAAALERIVRRQQAVRNRFPGLEIMRSIPIGSAGYGAKVASLEMASLFEPFSDWFLTDTLLFGSGRDEDMEQPVDGYIGITGKICDWEVAAALVAQSTIPVILAGGIGPENAAAGIKKVTPAGVDSCTRTNALDSNARPVRFKKDLEKVASLVAAARRTERRNRETIDGASG